MKYYFYILAFLFVAVSCNKTLVKYNGNFEGTWYSESRYDNINETFVRDEFVFSGSNGTYQIDCKDTCETNLCSCVEKLSGRAEINSQKTIIRLVSNFNRTFQLDAEPYEVAGKWLMKVDGRMYYKQ